MAALTLNTDYEIVDSGPGGMGVKEIVIRAINTVDAADTLTVTLTSHGIAANGLIGVVGFKHTTDNSVTVQEQPTTSVTSGVLTITVPAGTDNDSRFYVIKGFSSKDAAVSSL